MEVLIAQEGLACNDRRFEMDTCSLLADDASGAAVVFILYRGLFSRVRVFVAHSVEVGKRVEGCSKLVAGGSVCQTSETIVLLLMCWIALLVPWLFLVEGWLFDFLVPPSLESLS